MLKAGVAKLDITPPVGVRMSGFAGRVFPSLAVHDPLYARGLVLDDGENRLAVVALDLVGIWHQITEQVRAECRRSAGIPADGLLIAGSHTHSGPVFWDDGTFTDQERGYWDALPAKLIAVVNQAAAAAVPARLGVARGWSAIGINRREVTPTGQVVLGRNHFGVFDPEVGLIRIETADGKPLAALVNYACHAVCLMADNYLLSADYPGFAAHYLEQRMGGGLAVFFNGACGNVNPREAAVGHGLASGGGFSIAQRAGSQLARDAFRAWEKAIPGEDVKLSFARTSIGLPTNRARALEAAEEALRQAEEAARQGYPEKSPYMTWYAPPNPEGARKRIARLKEEGDAPVACEIQVISLGKVTFVGWPGEIFCELGMAVKERTPFPPTFILGYANNSIGYVPVPEAYREGGYEASTAAHLADNAGLVLVEETLKLLEGMRRG